MKARAGLLIAVAVFGACTGTRRTSTRVSHACERGDSIQVRTELFFGRNVPGGGEVSDSAWKEFVASYVTPRYPNGLTIIESTGQWRNAAGVIERERGFILQVGGGDDDTTRRLTSDVAMEYKRRFRQEAVLRFTSGVCVRFFDA